MRDHVDPPVLTSWKIEILHGLQQCEEGLQWGHGWVCYDHDPAVGIHGYVLMEDMLEGLREHLLECSGHG